MYLYRKNPENKWYLALLEDKIYDSKYNERYFEVIKPDFRCDEETPISQLYDNKSDVVRLACSKHFDSPSDKQTIERHKKYAYKDLDEIRSLYICHSCKIIMWHSMVWCFKCPAKITPSKITNRRLIELYDEGYKIGW